MAMRRGPPLPPGRGASRPATSKSYERSPQTISPSNRTNPASPLHPVSELQRLEFRPEHLDEGVRQCRELWEILRRKKGCVLHRLFHAQADRLSWLAYSECNSLAELAGARRELARSPLYRRFHARLSRASERAYEAFGAVRSSQGSNSAQALVLITFAQAPANGAEAMEFVRQAPGYLSHLMLHEVANQSAVSCLVYFAEAAQAQACAQALAPVAAFEPAAELYLA